MRTVMISTRLAALTAAAATVVAATTMASPASASAARPARSQVWHQVTPNGMLNFADVGLALGARGTLNVIWATGGTSGGNAKIMDTPVTFAGAVGRAATIVSGGYQFTDPDATVTGNQIDAIWNGVLNSTPSSPQGTLIASRAMGGGSWSAPSVIPPQPGVPDTSSADTAATGSDGEPWVAWYGTDSMTVLHVGHAEQQATPPVCCAYYPGLAVDGRSGTAWLGYMSNMTNHVGVFVQRLKQDGTNAGKAQLLPGTDTQGQTFPLNARIALTGRGHGRSGVYVAYLTGWPFALGVNLLQAGSRKAVRVARTNSAHQFAGVAVSANSAGGLWLAWTNGDGSNPGLTVRESNNTVRRFGTPKRVALPSGTSTIWKVYIKAVGSRLDVVALLTRHGRIAYYYTQVR
jgi:hypothetical protein